MKNIDANVIKRLAGRLNYKSDENTCIWDKKIQLKVGAVLVDIMTKTAKFTSAEGEEVFSFQHKYETVENGKRNKRQVHDAAQISNFFSMILKPC